MMRSVRALFDSFRGAGHYSTTIPPMDGALSPNDLLDEAPQLLSVDQPDNLLSFEGRLYFSSSDRIMQLVERAGESSCSQIASFRSEIVCMAARDGRVVVGLDSGELLSGTRIEGPYARLDSGAPTNCLTAIAFADADTLLLANGSASHRRSKWRYDLMEGNRTGSVWRINLADGRHDRLADRLGFPSGILPLPRGDAIVSESWRHRLIRLAQNRSPETVCSDFPAYPGRLAWSPDNKTSWLAMFAPRRQLVEFVRREAVYRDRMMKEVPEEYWVCPSYAPMKSFLEPLQGGSLKKLARLKPWAPSRSYGLLVQLDANQQPARSFHSRADGTRHGIASSVFHKDELVVTSKGGNAILAIDPDGQSILS